MQIEFANRSRRVGIRCLFALWLTALPAFAKLADYSAKPDDWFRTPEATRVIENVLSHQSPAGSWPKSLDPAAARYTNDPALLRGTFDNGATTGELRFLARAFRVTQEPRCRAAVIKALDHVLQAQYTNGGWPQYFPPGKDYHRHITFNDDTLKHLLELLRDAATAKEFAFVDEPRRQRAAAAFDLGIGCIVRCQVKMNGRLTVWCAQHDEVTLEPRPARTYELVSLSAAESAGLLRLLMSLDRPSPEVRRAIEAGAVWFADAKLTGLRQEKVNGNKQIVRDPGAPPLWARFYELETNRPIFSGRDGAKKYDLAEIEAERRNGYAWYGNWGDAVARDYGTWKAKQPRVP